MQRKDPTKLSRDWLELFKISASNILHFAGFSQKSIITECKLSRNWIKLISFFQSSTMVTSPWTISSRLPALCAHDPVPVIWPAQSVRSSELPNQLAAPSMAPIHMILLSRSKRASSKFQPSKFTLCSTWWIKRKLRKTNVFFICRWVTQISCFYV